MMLQQIFNHCAITKIPFEYIPEKDMVIIKSKNRSVERMCIRYGFNYVESFDVYKIVGVR